MAKVKVGDRLAPGANEVSHPEGHCRCPGKKPFIIRAYMGYGLCGICGKLTSKKLFRRR